MSELSVALCTYNGAEYVGCQLSSIASQTRLPDEVVVCDDVSSDGTVDIVQEFSLRAPFPVRVCVNDERLGVVKNFEKAVSLCRGELIALADQDDSWLSEKLEKQEKLLVDHPDIGLVFCDAEVVDENLAPLGKSLWECIGFSAEKQRRMREGRAFEQLFLERNYVAGTTAMFRSQFKKILLPFPRVENDSLKGRVIHDGWIAIMISAVSKLDFINERLVKYRQNPSQQIGVSLETIVPSLTAERLVKRNYRDQIEQLEFLERALVERVGEERAFTALDMVRDKLLHFKTRQEIRGRSVARLPLVLRELGALRYHKYSNGFSSALKDLILG